MIGLGTYSFFWQFSDRAPKPLSLVDMLRQTKDLGVDLFQICDYAPLESYSAGDLRSLRSVADELEMRLELGTKGVGKDHLATFLSLAQALDAAMVRSMVSTADGQRPLTESERDITAAASAYQDAGVTLALETYEQIPSADLVRLVESVASDAVGICLDPANCVAGLEHPNDVIDRCAPFVVNMHIKDFRFSRREGLVGFTLEGAQLGTGLLDFRHLMSTVKPESRGISMIVEHWIPWCGSFDETVRLETEWTQANVAYLRRPTHV